MLAATSVQQSVAFVIVAIFAVGAILWLLGNVRKAKPEVGAEIELAANRKPYYSDDEMEGKRLDGVLRWALISLTIVAVGLPLYWLAEPGRQAGAIKNFQSTFEHRGELLSLPTAQGGFNCQGCHGGVSGGGVAATITDADGKLRQVWWEAPSLDDVALRMTEDQLREVLTYGRPFSPMPAWGLEGGGPMNEQQIDNLIAWLQHIAISPEEARERATTAAEAELAILRDLDAALVQAEQDLEDLPADATNDQKLQAQAAVSRILAMQDNPQAPTMGAALFNVQCARCHTPAASYFEPGEPGSGAFGPPLSNVLTQFDDEEEHVSFVTDGREFGEQYGRQGKASGRMPYFARILTEEQIQAIVDYERELARQEDEQ
jgi:mono/diheme cytochrome c family protein